MKDKMEIKIQIKLTLISTILLSSVIVFFIFLLFRFYYFRIYVEKKDDKEYLNIKKIIKANLILNKEETKYSEKNHLDQFLSAIKIFGYLEKPVFYELTKNMYTYRLSPDEIIHLNSNFGFYVVVEGVVQVYIKIKNQKKDFSDDLTDNNHDDFDDDKIFYYKDNRYLLLNEVKSGTPLSSLMSALEMFKPQTKTENDDDSDDFQKRSIDFEIKNIFNLESSNTSVFLDNFDDSFEIIAKMKTEIGDERNKSSKNYIRSDTTICVIPQEAFKRVQTMYPKATSNIVTIVLIRFFKVTMTTLISYLGLTNEIIKSETEINKHKFELNDEDQKTAKKLFNNLKLKNKSCDLNDKSESETSFFESFSKKKNFPVKNCDFKSHEFKRLRSKSFVNLSHNSTLNQDFKNEKFYSESFSIDDLNLDYSFSKDDIKLKNDDKVKNFFNNTIKTTKLNELTLQNTIADNIFKVLGINDHLDLIYKNSYFKNNNSKKDNQNNNHQSFIKTLNKDKNKNKTNSHLSKVSDKNFVTLFKSLNPIEKNVNDHIISNKNLNINGQNVIKEIKGEFSNLIKFQYYGNNEQIIEQKSFEYNFFYVVVGELSCYYSNIDNENESIFVSPNNKPKKLFVIKEGGISGYFSSILGLKSLTTVKVSSKHGALLAYITKKDFIKFTDKYYFLQLPIALKFKEVLSKLIWIIDCSLEWCHVTAGNCLYSQSDDTDGFHIVVGGRFREIKIKSNPKNQNNNHAQDFLLKKSIYDNDDYEILGEYGQGNLIGELEVLTGKKRLSSLLAIRDSETARVPKYLFEILSSKLPSVMVKLSKMVATKLDVAGNKFNMMESNLTYTYIVPKAPNQFKIITVFPSSNNLPVVEFANKLLKSLKELGKNVFLLDQKKILLHLRSHAFDEKLSQLKLSGYFTHLEEEYQIVIYVCDTPVKSDWTYTCISQADCILLLANAADTELAYGIGEYEKLLINTRNTPKIDLCLLHQEKFVVPKSTSVWLKNRHWVDGHHHIYMKFSVHFRLYKAKKKYNVIQELASKFNYKNSLKENNFNDDFKDKKNIDSHIISSINFSDNFDLDYLKNDFARLARILSNEAIGLVLGGGGSRGIAHISIIKSIVKSGIPIDIVGGCSIGSFIGGLYAKECNSAVLYNKAKKFSKKAFSIWRIISDLTIPISSYVTGCSFNKEIWKVFGSTEIEDFWIKFFCNSTNISSYQMNIHETGCLWRFVRASMSLAGLLPPISHNNDMLLDGGYLDNLPVLEMKKKGAKYIIAVDVGSNKTAMPMNYGDSLSGLWVLINKWNPFSTHPDIPNIMDLQMRLAYVSSVNALKFTKKLNDIIYLRPPIDNYNTLDFSKFDEIYKTGLQYADNFFKTFDFKVRLPILSKYRTKYLLQNSKKKNIYHRRNSI